jgi:hypothetical protein
MSAARILVARETAQITYGKKGLERVIVHKGVTRVREGHPMLKGHADLFEPLRPHFEVGEAVDDEPVLEPDEPAECAACAARAEAEAAQASEAPSEPEADAPVEPAADAPVETVAANPGQKRVTKPRTPRAPRVKRG